MNHHAAITRPTSTVKRPRKRQPPAIQPDPAHLLFKMIEAVVQEAKEQVGDLGALTRDMPRLTTDEQKERIGAIKKKAKAIKELAGWCFPDHEPLPFLEVFAHAADYQKAGWPDSAIQHYLEIAQKRCQGATATRRHHYIFALAMDFWKPRPSWRERAQQLCNCKAKIHSRRCADNLRRGVNKLKVLLVNYGIDPKPRGSAET